MIRCCLAREGGGLGESCCNTVMQFAEFVHAGK